MTLTEDISGAGYSWQAKHWSVEIHHQWIHLIVGVLLPEIVEVIFLCAEEPCNPIYDNGNTYEVSQHLLFACSQLEEMHLLKFRHISGGGLGFGVDRQVQSRDM